MKVKQNSPQKRLKGLSLGRGPPGRSCYLLLSRAQPFHEFPNDPSSSDISVGASGEHPPSPHIILALYPLVLD